MAKRISIAVVVLALGIGCAFGLVACGGGSKTTTETVQGGGVTPVPVTPTHQQTILTGVTQQTTPTPPPPTGPTGATGGGGY